MEYTNKAIKYYARDGWITDEKVEYKEKNETGNKLEVNWKNEV